MAISNRFFDETKIVKKNPSAQPQPVVEPIAEPVAESVPEVISEPAEKPKQPRKKKEESKKEEYEQLVKQIVEENPEVVPPKSKRSPIEVSIEQKKPHKLEKPVYHYAMGQDGKPVVTVKGSAQGIEIIDEASRGDNMETKENLMMQMLEKTESEIIRLVIELDIHAQLINQLPARKQVFENKLRNIQEELEYNLKRKEILKKMLSIK